MKVLITGGAGFIGSHLVRFHLQRGDDVIVIDNLSTGNLKNLQNTNHDERLTIIQEEIVNCHDLPTLLVDVERVYHMAAIVGVQKVLKEPVDTITQNINSLIYLLRTISELSSYPRVIVASSSEVYGDNCIEKAENEPLLLSDASEITHAYAISKLANESTAKAFFHEFNLPVTILRLFNTIGPKQTGRYGMVAPCLTQQALQNAALTIYGNGEQTRSFCDVRDMVAMIDKLCVTEKSIGEVVNIGNNLEVSINQLAETIIELLGSKSEMTYMSFEQAFGPGYHDTQRRKPNLEKLKMLIGYEYQYTLEQTVLDIATSIQNMEN